ncbi:MAG: hypothetical protein H7A43_02240 [Verrucomicrobia bacterium]|nr:hypothetical protein [Verrucomicrobiota bacterium]
MSTPSNHPRRSTIRDRKRLAAWMAEREIDLTLREDMPSPHTEVAPEVLRYDRSIRQPGEIYILRPASVDHPVWLGPVYSLMLKSQDGGELLAVPFGRYAVPAVPGEWATGLRSVPLRVLCFWNARPAAGLTLLPGVARKLPGSLLAKADQAGRHILAGEPVHESVSKGFGPPLVHPADPRYAYLDEERARLDSHRAPGNPSLLRESHESRTEAQEERRAWLLAAEGRPGYGNGQR